MVELVSSGWPSARGIAAVDFSQFRAFAILILVLLFKPAGLLGKAAVEKV